MARASDPRLADAVNLLPTDGSPIPYINWKAAMVQAGLNTQLIQVARRDKLVIFTYDDQSAPPNNHTVRRAPPA